MLLSWQNKRGGAVAAVVLGNPGKPLRMLLSMAFRGQNVMYRPDRFLSTQKQYTVIHPFNPRLHLSLLRVLFHLKVFGPESDYCSFAVFMLFCRKPRYLTNDLLYKYHLEFSKILIKSKF